MPAMGASTATGYTSADATTTTGIVTQSATTVCVFAQWENSSTPPTITDSRSNTYSLVRSEAPSGGSYSNWIGAWICQAATGGSGHTVTASKTAGYASVWVVEVTDADAYTHNGGASGSSPYSSGDVSPAVAALLVGFSGYEGTGTTAATPSAGFSIANELTDFSYWQGVTATRSVSAGTHGFTAAVTQSVDGGAILLALTSGSPPPPPPTPSNGVLRTYVGGQWVAGHAKGRVGSEWVSTLPKGYLP